MSFEDLLFYHKHSGKTFKKFLYWHYEISQPRPQGVLPSDRAGGENRPPDLKVKRSGDEVGNFLTF